MGTKMGWIIATAIVLAVILAFCLIVLFPTSSHPNETLAEGFLELKTVSVPLSGAVGFEAMGHGDAAPDYQRAIEVYLANYADIDAVGDGEHWDDLVEDTAERTWTDPGLKKIQEIHTHVAAAVKRSRMNYTFVHTDKRLDFVFRHPAAEKFWKVAVALRMLANMLEAKGRHAEAARVIRHMLVMGRHMYDEHRAANMGLAGLEIQDFAVRDLGRLFRQWKGSPQGAGRWLEKYELELKPALRIYRKKKEIVWDNVPKDDDFGEPKLNAGDVFNMVEHDEDRAWRVQAIIALGAVKLRWKHHRGNRKEALRLIQKYKANSDEMLAAAAKAADELTEEQFRTSGQ
jgi:hypothetical protein